MFFLTYSSIWSLTFFFFITYTTLITSLMLYVIPALSNNLNMSSTKIKNISDFINGIDIFWIASALYSGIILISILWISPSFSIWFGHLIVSPFQLKITYFIIFYFFLLLLVFSSTTYFSSREIYDYLITIISFLYWIILLFHANSVFTVIFIVEVLSSLIFLFLVTSTFSTGFFYRNTNLSFGTFFQNSTPFMYLQSIIFFFWMSLLSSLNLFIFLIFLYLKLFTFDWFLIEFVTNFILNTSSLNEIIALAMVWFILMFSLFLKCGIAPLYIWKPTFFKGIPYYTLFFYINFFYFFIFLFIISFLSIYLSELFYYFILVNLLFILGGLLMLLSILCETYYLKSFLAMSSILNSLIVFLALSSSHITIINFWL